MRLYFITQVSQIEPIGDAAEYYNQAGHIRNFLCLHYLGCEQGPVPFQNEFQTPPPDESPLSLGYLLLNGRAGILPLLPLLVEAVMGPDLRNTYFLFALLDSIMILLVGLMVRHLGLPHWASLAAGLAYAVHVPAIIFTGALLRHPLERWFLLLVLYSTLLALREQKVFYWRLALCANLLMGFSGLYLRPLMWAILGLSLLWGVSERVVWRAYLPILPPLILALAALSWAFSRTESVKTPSQAFVVSYLGLSTTTQASSNDAYYTVWLPDVFYRDKNEFKVEAASKTPEQGLNFLLLRIYASLEKPDTTYLQAFGLSLPQQGLQHQVYLLLALSAYPLLLSSPDALWRRYGVLLGLTLAYLALMGSLFSVEVRRLSPLYPLYSVLATLMLQFFLSQGRKAAVYAWVLWGLLLCLNLLPLVLWDALLPGSLATAYAARGLLILGLIIGAGFLFWPPTWPQRFMLLAYGLALIILHGVHHRQMEHWRAWDVQLEEPIQQSLSLQSQPAGLYPWLLVDVHSQDPLGRDLELRLDGELLKPFKQPFYPWRAGLPPSFISTAQLLALAQPPQDEDFWLAYPLPQNLPLGQILTIELSSQGGMRVYGDDISGLAGQYFGPAWGPDLKNFSLLYWAWNGQDNRLPERRALNADYHSAYWSHEAAAWQGGDLSPGFGQHTGLYRVFVTWQPFAQGNPILRTPNEYFFHQPNTDDCPTGLAAMTTEFPLELCFDSEGGAFLYTTSGERLAEVSALLDSASQATLARLELAQGWVDFFQFDRWAYIINFYDSEGALVASGSFKLPSVE